MTWKGEHLRWLNRQSFERPAQRLAFNRADFPCTESGYFPRVRVAQLASARQRLDQILAASKQTTDNSQLNVLTQAYQAVADTLSVADPRAGGVLDQIFAASKQTTDSYQLKALAEAYQAVADKLPAADPRAGGLLDQILAVSKQTTDSYQLKALAEAYQAAADKLPADTSARLALSVTPGDRWPK